MTETPKAVDISTQRLRVAEMARKMPGVRLNTLAHHIDMDWMRAAYARTRKDGAVGVDGQSAREFAEDMEGNLGNLLVALKTGRYRAPPVRAVEIPKADGRTRQIGIPTFGDKVMQRAVAMVLEEVYELEFLDGSYGFRPGRSAHMALEKLWGTLMNWGGGMVLELDIKSFFDDVQRGHLNVFLDERIGDGVLRRAIGKWLNAGVMKDGQREEREKGTPQGGVISPLLANIYLHVVLDRWLHEEVKPRLRGQVELMRYADDAVLVFSNDEDARRVMEVLPQRFGRFGLTLHPEKTRLVEFRRPRASQDGTQPPEPGSFDFLGFTHCWARSRKGAPVVRRQTAKGRLKRSLQGIKKWCQQNRHRSLVDQHAGLLARLRGHYTYFNLPGNGRLLDALWHHAKRIWKYWLGRRSQRAPLSWVDYLHHEKEYPLPRYWQRCALPAPSKSPS